MKYTHGVAKTGKNTMFLHLVNILFTRFDVIYCGKIKKLRFLPICVNGIFTNETTTDWDDYAG